MSTDHELLELVAKAVGSQWTGKGYWILPRADGVWHEWDPLESDGDALRLAASLELYLVFCKEEVSVMGVDDTSLDYFDEPYGNDRMAATRRAIVRAAAEIGRSMK